jgi:hypothetical protein
MIALMCSVVFAEWQKFDGVFVAHYHWNWLTRLFCVVWELQRCFVEIAIFVCHSDLDQPW